jgi:hypothetical protein
MIAADLRKRLLYILHRGLVEIRLLGQGGRSEQISDLADILEPLPSWLTDNPADTPSAVEIKAEFERYERKYAGSFKYSDFLDKYDPPAF